MTIRRGRLAAGLAVFVLAGATACGGVSGTASTQSAEQPSSQSKRVAAAGVTAGCRESAETKTRPAVDASVVRRTVGYDYEPATSVTALAEGNPSATLGKVVGWTDGRSQVESDGSGYEYTSLFAVLEIEVVDSYRAPDGHGDDDRIYVEVSRGGVARVDGELPEGGEPVVSTIDELDSAVPSGTRVIVVGRGAPTAAELEDQTPGSKVHNEAAGRPSGALLLRAHVQGLIFEDEHGDFVSGLTEDEDQDQWGWVPTIRPACHGFSYLVDQLAGMEK